MPSWRDHFLNLTIEARQQYVKKYADKIKSPTILGSLPFLPAWYNTPMSRKDIVDFALRHGLYSKLDFLKACSTYKLENPPTIEQVTFIFGSFEEFQRQLRNSPKAKYWNGRMTDREFVQFCSRIHVKDIPSYLKIREEHPEFKLPSLKPILHRFGRWELFMSLVRSFDVDLQLDLYFKKSIEVGRPLKPAECDKYGIEIRYLKSILTDQLLRKLLFEKERWYRKNKPECFMKKRHKSFERTLKVKRKKKKKHEKQRSDSFGITEAILEEAEAQKRTEAQENVQELSIPQGN